MYLRVHRVAASWILMFLLPRDFSFAGDVAAHLPQSCMEFLPVLFMDVAPYMAPVAQSSDLSKRQAQLASSKPELSARFAVTEYRGDQKIHARSFWIASQLAVWVDLPPL